MGLLYFNLSSIFWTSCFALTLYRDMIHSYTRGTLRKCGAPLSLQSDGASRRVSGV